VVAERVAHRVIKRRGILRPRAITKVPGTLVAAVVAERAAHRVTVVVAVERVTRRVTVVAEAEAADTAGAVEAKAVTAEAATAEDTARRITKFSSLGPKSPLPANSGLLFTGC
jgi:hypothetical protein